MQGETASVGQTSIIKVQNLHAVWPNTITLLFGGLGVTGFLHPRSPQDGQILSKANAHFKTYHIIDIMQTFSQGKSTESTIH